MLALRPGWSGELPRILALGAHCDDIEIGAGGTLLSLAAAHPGMRVRAVVLTSTPDRAAETRAALPQFVPDAELDLTIHELPDGRLPQHWGAVKDILESVRRDTDPDLILAPSPTDAHQDHRLLGELVTTAFRDHLVLGYEILKWDGDVGRPGFYSPLSADRLARKIELLQKYYPSQHGRSWFDEESFRALARLRGVECHSPYAEAFSCRKAVFGIG